MYNNKLVNDLCKRKLFKTNVYHKNNSDEEYYWDDYDTTYSYKPRNPVRISTRHIPKIKNKPINLHANEKVKILLTRKAHKASQTSIQTCNATTQTDASNTTTDETTQTFLQYYFSQTSRFPGPSSNFNFAPFNPDIIL